MGIDPRDDGFASGELEAMRAQDGVELYEASLDFRRFQQRRAAMDARQQERSEQYLDPAAAREQVVQVRIVGAPRAYAYAVPAGMPDLEAGDWVLLPGNVVSPDGCEGVVEGFGRDGYKGALKYVLQQVDRPGIWLAQMRAARTKAQALKVYRAAVKAGVGGERLAALVDAGRTAANR